MGYQQDNTTTNLQRNILNKMFFDSDDSKPKFNPHSHIVYYKNYKIVYENGEYRLPELPTLPFRNMSAAKKEIDKVTKDLEDNLQNLKELISKKTSR